MTKGLANASSSPDIDALYRSHHRMVRRRVLRFVREQEANDLVQLVFERATRHRHTFRGNTGAVSWLYQIATRTCLHYLRDTSRRDDLVSRYGMPVWCRPGPPPDAEARVFLQEAWNRLDPELAEIGTYHYVDGLTHDEISSLMGCSRRTVGNRIRDLRQQIISWARPQRSTA